MVTSELELDIRYYETDQMGIVHHSNYLRYFECGRSRLLIDLGIPIERIEREGFVFPVISASLKYRFPARMGDRIRIVSSVDKIPSGAKMVINASIFNQDGVLLCDGAVALGILDAESRCPVRCPEFMIEAFRKADR